jgi:FkbM family methyltransferase
MFDKQTETIPDDAIAIIGLSGRFPGAANNRQFWENLRAGKESISFFSDQELIDAGVDAALLKEPGYVKAAAMLDGIENFAASFFGFTPKEAELTDPQHRMFIECAWEALEDGGHVPEQYEGRIGVYAGSGLNTYMIANLLPNYQLLESMGVLQLVIGNRTDFMPTKVSYKLDLNGASVNVNTACSTSLVAVHMACRSLLNYECDMALAGGVTAEVPQKKGYLYQHGGVLSPDGHCRPFDAKAQGTVAGSGAGVVLLKRLEEAIEEGDHIYAVIRGSAINNDGAQKVGYTAPSTEGQKEVIALALAMAEVEPQTISYVEAHGTGTSLGDPIEVRALTQAFRMGTDKTNFCAIGSVKSNIGHLDAAAGVASLIKVALCLEHRELVPSLHFEQPNPAIDFSSTPFYVNSALREWKANDAAIPLRAGVSSFGIGGTNAHVVLEQAPRTTRADDTRKWKLLLLSAQTETALDAATENLCRHLEQSPGCTLPDVAYTLQTGRRAFNYRRMFLCDERGDAVNAIRQRDPRRSLSGCVESHDSAAGMVFMFPGIGDQTINMAAGLYQDEPVFRQVMDQCATILQPLLELDIRELLYPKADTQSVKRDDAMPSQPTVSIDLRKMLKRSAEPVEQENANPAWMRKTSLVHPALFMIEYSLARTFIALGIQPTAMIGHSLGEYVAACVAGVMSLEDALTVVVKRASMIQELPEGRMLAVAMPAETLKPMVADGLSIAAINGPTMSVIAGPGALVGEFERYLRGKGIAHLPVQSAHAFHSSMLLPVQGPLRSLFQTIELKAPAIPYISNLSGSWMTAEQATDPDYWVSHTCQTVRFGDGIKTLCEGGARTFIEMGPGQTLSSFLQQHPAAQAREDVMALSSLPGMHENAPDSFALTHTLGVLWCRGSQIDWAAYHRHETCKRVSLPTYPFERERYWIDAVKETGSAGEKESGRNRADEMTKAGSLLYAPFWSSAPATTGKFSAPENEHWLIFQDDQQIGAALVRRLVQHDRTPVVVRRGDRFEQLDQAAYAIRPDNLDDYRMLAAALERSGTTPHNVVHMWALAGQENVDVSSAYASLLCLAKTFGAGERDDRKKLRLAVISTDLHVVTGEEDPVPENALLLGPCCVIPLEFPNIRCCNIDLGLSGRAQNIERMIDGIVQEFAHGLPQTIAAYRGRLRWTRSFEAIEGEESHPSLLREAGVYVIVDYQAAGLSHLLVEYLARQRNATLVLMVQETLPSREEWARYLSEPDAHPLVCDSLRGIMEIESLGAKVAIIDAVQTLGDAQAFEQVVNRHADITGVLHALPSFEYGLIQFESEALPLTLRREMQRMSSLAQAMEKLSPDFVALVSSNIGFAGAVGQTDSCAASAFVQSIGDKLLVTQQKPVRSIAVDVRDMHVPGLDSDAFPPALSKYIEAGRKRYALEKTSFFEALAAAFSMDKPQLAASAADLKDVIREMGDATLPEVLHQVKMAGNVRSTGKRPPYVEPETDIEKQVTTIWESLLGAKQIGLDDGFFNLGGNSLLAVQFISRVREAYQIDLSLKSLFQSSTVREVSIVVENILLQEIEALSDDEVEQRMQQYATEDHGRTSVEPTLYELPNKWVVQHFNKVETDHFYHDIFDAKVYFRNGITLEEGAVIFDVGANIGLFSLFAHHQCNNAKIYAFEPAPPVFEALQKNMQSYAVNANLFKCGVGNQARKESLTFYPHSTGMSSFHPDKEEEKEVLRAIMHNQLNDGMEGMQQVMEHVDDILEERFRDTSYECELVTLSNIIRTCDVQRIDLLKVDVQKSELEVIEGIEDEHWKIIRQIVMEVHDLDDRVASVCALLESRGFRVIVEQELLYRTSSISNVYGIRA